VHRTCKTRNNELVVLACWKSDLEGVHSESECKRTRSLLSAASHSPSPTHITILLAHSLPPAPVTSFLFDLAPLSLHNKRRSTFWLLHLLLVLLSRFILHHLDAGSGSGGVVTGGSLKDGESGNYWDIWMACCSNLLITIPVRTSAETGQEKAV
jgi:hypothetical protein